MGGVLSARGRAAEGYVADPTGFFATQPQVTRAALPFLGIKPGMRILEPSCGKGAIGKVLREVYGGSVTITGVEIDKKRAKAAAKATVLDTFSSLQPTPVLKVFDKVICSDFYKVEPEPYDLLLTNPSFSIWQPFADHCFKFGPTTLLLPFNVAASKKRMQWWHEHPAFLRVLSKRPSFAISVKCVMATKKNKFQCDFQEMIGLDEAPRETCPQCDSRITTTRSDASEYCWASWGPDITEKRWDVIETPEEKKA